MQIVILQGHPDPEACHLDHALADSYARGAKEGGHEVRRIAVAGLPLPFLTSNEEWESSPVPEGLAGAQRDLHWAEHLVIVHPLWLGGMPARLKAFLEQVLRPGFAFPAGPSRGGAAGLLVGRTARIVVTMGMPSWYYVLGRGAHATRSLRRDVLDFVGIRPVRTTLLGLAFASEARRAGWTGRMHAVGRKAR